jgi:hypothetical protein
MLKHLAWGCFVLLRNTPSDSAGYAPFSSRSLLRFCFAIPVVPRGEANGFCFVFVRYESCRDKLWHGLKMTRRAALNLGGREVTLAAELLGPRQHLQEQELSRVGQRAVLIEELDVEAEI